MLFEVLHVLNSIFQAASVVCLSLWCADLGNRIRNQRIQFLTEDTFRQELYWKMDLRMQLLESELKKIQKMEIDIKNVHGN